MTACTIAKPIRCWRCSSPLSLGKRWTFRFAAISAHRGDRRPSGESGLATSVSVSFRKVRGMSERRFRRILGEGRAVRIVDGARTVVDETQPGE